MVRGITIKEIARLAGVSVGSVSTVFSKKNTNVHLSAETRERILKVARENHYVPNITARAMQSRKSYLLGFFYRASNWYLLSGILQGIRQVCSLYDYDIIVYPSGSLAEEKYNLESSHVNQLDGIITIPLLENGRDNQAVYHDFGKREIPVIQLLADFWPDLPMVGRDYRKTGKEAVRVLAARGHRHVGLMIFDNYHDPVGGCNNRELLLGIQSGAEECGVTLEIYPLDSDVRRENLIQNADLLTENLIRSRKRPTALITASSNLAYGAYACFQRHNVSVPADISLLACGDDTEPFWQLAPDLAYFPVPLRQLGRLSAEYCLEPKTPQSGRELLFSPLVEGKTIGSVS